MPRRLLLLVCAVVVSCSASTPPTVVRLVTVELRQGASTLRIRAEVADTEELRRTGLMHRKSLARDAGMLFVFPQPVRSGFYMKDTLIPLDVAFIRAEQVVAIESMVPCRADPCPITTPVVDYDEALEVGAGVFAQAGITPGAAVSVSGIPPGGD